MSRWCSPGRVKSGPKRQESGAGGSASNRHLRDGGPAHLPQVMLLPQNNGCTKVEANLLHGTKTVNSQFRWVTWGRALSARLKNSF